MIPAWRAGGTVGAALESVRAQSVTDWEAHVVDDGSPDDTREVAGRIAATDPRITVHALGRNTGGPAEPRNAGVAAARAPWVAFLDADDIWHPRKLELQLDALARSGADLAATAMRDFADGDAPAFPPVARHGLARLPYWRVRLRNALPTSSVLVRTELARAHPFAARPVEDYHCWLRMLAAGARAVKLRAVLVRYRISPGQVSAAKGAQLAHVYRVHRDLAGGNRAVAGALTATHALGAALERALLRGM